MCMQLTSKKWNTIKDNKYWVKSTYENMIHRYKDDIGGKTDFGVTITHKFIDILKSRYIKVCRKTLWI